jgi:hypothetical protein
MACASCGSKPMTPVVRQGYPTIWAWVEPAPDLVAIPVADAETTLFLLNGPVT